MSELESDPFEERAFLELQHRFRGLVSEFKSKRFVEKRTVPPSRVLGIDNF
jgi:hypothetical protein